MQTSFSLCSTSFLRIWLLLRRRVRCIHSACLPLLFPLSLLSEKSPGRGREMAMEAKGKKEKKKEKISFFPPRRRHRRASSPLSPLSDRPTATPFPQRHPSSSSFSSSFSIRSRRREGSQRKRKRKPPTNQPDLKTKVYRIGKVEEFLVFTAAEYCLFSNLNCLCTKGRFLKNEKQLKYEGEEKKDKQKGKKQKEVLVVPSTSDC